MSAPYPQKSSTVNDDQQNEPKKSSDENLTQEKSTQTSPEEMLQQDLTWENQEVASNSQSGKNGDVEPPKTENQTRRVVFPSAGFDGPHDWSSKMDVTYSDIVEDSGRSQIVESGSRSGTGAREQDEPDELGDEQNENRDGQDEHRDGQDELEDEQGHNGHMLDSPESGISSSNSMMQQESGEKFKVVKLNRKRRIETDISTDDNITPDMSRKFLKLDSRRGIESTPNLGIISPASSSLTSWRDQAFASTHVKGKSYLLADSLRRRGPARARWLALIAEGNELKKKQSKEILLYRKMRQMNQCKKPKGGQNVKTENIENAEIRENGASIFSRVRQFFWPS